MQTNQRCGRLAGWIFLVCLAWPHPGLHAQGTYTASPGQTSISSDYDPTAPAPRSRVRSVSYGHSDPLPTLSEDRYLAQKAEIAGFSRTQFSSPPQTEVTTLSPHAVTAPNPIASSATYSWQGIQDTGLEPPSANLAVGPSDVLMVVNSTIAQFSRSGTQLNSITFDNWFNDVLSATCPANCLLYDPWIVYDQLHGRFLLLISAAPQDLASRSFSYLLISVSKGATYAGGWKNFALNASLDGNVQTQLFGDSWRVGLDNQAVYLSGNMFDTNDVFHYAKIRILKKSDLYNPAATTLPYQEFGSATAVLKNANGTVADSLIPMHQRGQPGEGAVGLLASATTFNLPATFLTIWKVSNPLSSAPTLAQFNIPGLMSYGLPASAPQLATGATLSTGDTRMLKLIYRNGFLYTARNTGYTDQATSITYDVIDTTAMQAVSQVRTTGSISFFPAFDVTATTPPGAQAITTNPITGTTTAADGSLTFAGISNLKTGESAFFGVNACVVCRWGDYFGGTIDPVSGGLWVSGQYAKPPITIQTPSGPQQRGQWGTWAGYFPWLTTQTFTDVLPSSSFFDFVNVLNGSQITMGCSASAFCPADMVTRDQFATFIIRSMIGNTFTYSTTPHFTDVPSTSPYFPFIQKLADLGLTHGCSATSYCPTGTVPRQDAAVLLVRGKLESLFGDSFTYPTTPFFTDVPPSSPQFPYVQKMYELGLTSGCTLSQFCPSSNLTREEIAAFLDRAFVN